MNILVDIKTENKEGKILKSDHYLEGDPKMKQKLRHKLFKNKLIRKI